MPAPTRSPDSPFAEINIIPFVDVVLVLLIIFMITAPVLFNSVIPMTLPKAASGESDETVDLTIVILKDGSLRLDGKPADIEALRSRVRDRHPPRAILSADAETRHGRVVEILDLLRQEGVSSYAIAVEPPTEERKPPPSR